MLFARFQSAVCLAGAAFLFAELFCAETALSQFAPGPTMPSRSMPSPSRPSPGVPRPGPSRPSPYRRQPTPYRQQPNYQRPGYPSRGQPGRPNVPNVPGRPTPYGPTTTPGGSRYNNQPYSVRNPFSRSQTQTAAPQVKFGTSPSNRAYGVPIGQGNQPSQAWRHTQQLIRGGNLQQVRQSIDQNLQKDQSLGGLMSAVSALEQAKVPAGTLNPYRAQALQMARAQTKTHANDPLPWVAIAKFSLEDANDKAFRQATQTLIQKFPEQGHSHYFDGIRALKDEDWKSAERALRKAKELGVPEESIAKWLKMAIDRQKWVWQFAQITLVSLSVWLVGLGVLFILGKLMSVLTVGATRRGDPARMTMFRRLVRGSYRMLIGFAGVYYFLSLPMLLLFSIALPLSIGYALLILPVLSLWLIGVVFVVGSCSILTAISGLRACFVRANREMPGQRVLRQDEQPALWQLTREVADEVGTRPVDEIWLTPTADIGVFEEGGFFARMRDRGRRVLVLGCATLDGFSRQAFCSVLAHEYGHFQNRDTAGGDISLNVNRAMDNFADAIVARGKIRWWDTAVWFLRFYYALFIRLTFGASRLQEVLADQVAVTSYGADAFKQGLRHVIRQSIEFDYAVSKGIGSILRKNSAVVNLYRSTERPTITQREEIEAVFHQLLNRPTTRDDTHPSPKDRFAFADQLQVSPAPADSANVLELLDDPEKLMGDMNERMGRILEEEAAFHDQISEMKLAYLNRALAYNPIAEGYEERAAIHMERGDYENALQDLSTSLSKNPRSPNTRYARIIVYRAKKDYELAIRDIRQLFEQSPYTEDFDTYYLLGDCQYELGQYDKASKAFSSALHRDEKPFCGWMARGRTRFQLGNFEGAITDFDKAIERSPSCADAHYDRALAYKALGNVDLAIDDLRQATKLDPSYRNARDELKVLLNEPLHRALDQESLGERRPMPAAMSAIESKLVPTATPDLDQLPPIATPKNPPKK